MEIRVETPQPHIVLVTIANEKRRNAMSRAMLADLAALWDRLDQDAECRCVALAGAGEKAVCAGADIGRRLHPRPQNAPILKPPPLKGTPASQPNLRAIHA